MRGKKAIKLSLHILNLYIFGKLFLCFCLFCAFWVYFFLVLVYQKRLKTEVGAKCVSVPT